MVNIRYRHCAARNCGLGYFLRKLSRPTILILSGITTETRICVSGYHKAEARKPGCIYLHIQKCSNFKSTFLIFPCAVCTHMKSKKIKINKNIYICSHLLKKIILTRNEFEANLFFIWPCWTFLINVIYGKINHYHLWAYNPAINQMLLNISGPLMVGHEILTTQIGIFNQVSLSKTDFQQTQSYINGVLFKNWFQLKAYTLKTGVKWTNLKNALLIFVMILYQRIVC